MRCYFGSCIVLVLSFATSAQAVVLYSDNFESYVPGPGETATLDSNQTGPNAGTNGSGNPWWGPLAPNLYVVTSGENGVTAHGGNQMVRGVSSGGDFDQEYYNLQYRHNSGSPFQGNLSVDWWFYDPLGAGGTGFRDYGALSYYGSPPTDKDWPDNIASANLSGVAQRLSLGATNAAGFDATVYQARVVGATDGTINPQGWYNTTRARTVGWHEARISLGAPDGSNTQVSFYIDDMANPLLVHSIVSSVGVNILELNSSYGPTVGYYDDVTISSVTTLAGDYNHDGVVDARDYVVWRKGLGTTFTPPDYDTWRANFGKVAGSGVSLATAVPEPASVVIVFLGAIALCTRRKIFI